jgi:phytoene synthase
MSRARTPLSLYSEVAHSSAAGVISAYSTSFGMASRLLDPEVRPHIVNVYALVRVADEIVDGTAEEAGLGVAARRVALDRLESDVEEAIVSGFSANLVVHAFAWTARRTGFGPELIAPFFASMRRDLDPVDLTESEFRTYVYGSAEVVGLMCLRAFTVGADVDDALAERLARGARHLGAAFQKINFLRDLGEDYLTLGRRYFPDCDPAGFTDADRDRLLADIDRDLSIAAATIPELPVGSRRAVAAAHALFAELARRLRNTPAVLLLRTRVSVPAPRKAAILLRAAALAGSRPGHPVAAGMRR